MEPDAQEVLSIFLVSAPWHLRLVPYIFMYGAALSVLNEEYSPDVYACVRSIWIKSA